MRWPAVDRPAWERALAFAFQSPVASAALAILFAACGVVLVTQRVIVYDEGLLTHVFARWIVLDPLPVLFFQKSRPIESILFAIPSLAGPQWLFLAHVALGALTAPMLAAVARTLGLRLPNLAALIVLTSPLFLFGTATGVSNVDGVVGTILFLYLAVVLRRAWLAGIVLGCLPWIRFELAPFSIVLWLYMAAIERNRGAALAALVFPVVYAVAGAIYHHDLLWLVHYPPTTTFPMPGNPIWETQKIGLRYVLTAQWLVTPAIGFVLAARRHRLSPIERALALFACLSFFLLSFLPFLRLANFGPAARYSMQTLPMFALVAARAVEPWLDGHRASRTPYVLAIGIALIWAVSSGTPGPVALPILGAYFAFAFFARRGLGMGAAGAVVLAVCAGVALPRNEMTTPVYFHPALAQMEKRAEEMRGATIYTNSQVMPYAIAGSATLAASDVRFIVAPDMAWELTELSNPDNGQREALLKIVHEECFGPGVFWNEISPASVAPRSLFLLRDDPRLSLVMPDEVWAGRLEQIAGGEGFTLARVTASGAATTPLGLEQVAQ